MLANITLKRVINFHGHICPELAIGGKFCEFVQTLFNNGTIPTSGFSILAENSTSALDAIQVLLGATVGNQRLLVLDYGKHTYSLFSKTVNRGWKLKLRSFAFDNEGEYRQLEQKIAGNEAVFDEVILFQRILDSMVRKIMSLSPEDLFSIDETGLEELPTEVTASYLVCGGCGEKVLSSRGIKSGGSIYCSPCFQKIAARSGKYVVQ